MQNPRLIIGAVVASVVAIADQPVIAARPVGTAFTYQDQLKHGGLAVNCSEESDCGGCDFVFSLRDAATEGAQTGNNQTVSNFDVRNALFTVVLNESGQFGQDGFNGHARWLEAGIQCPGGGSPTTNAQSCSTVLDFGAIGNGDSHPLSCLFSTLEDAQAVYPHATSLCDELDWAGTQAAVNSGARVVFFPSGRYVLNRPIRPEVNHLTLQGEAGAVLVAESPDGEAILVSPGFPPLPGIERLTILDIAIEATNGRVYPGTVSTSVIQINNCHDCMVKNVSIDYTLPPGSVELRNLNGIGLSGGTSGLIEGCTVNGIPKAGILLAITTDVLVHNCETKNATQPAGTDSGFGRIGIGIEGAARAIISECHSHDNGNDGMIISATSIDDTPYPSTHIRVVGGTYENNRLVGIRFRRPDGTPPPRNIKVVEVLAQNNGAAGLTVDAGEDILIEGCSFIGNQGGITLSDVCPLFGADQTNRVTVRACEMIDNVNTGLVLRATNDTTVENSRFVCSVNRHCMRFGAIGIWKFPKSDKKNTNLRLVDVEIDAMKPFTADDQGDTDLSAVAPETGFYRIQSEFWSDPTKMPPSLFAPRGSEYTHLNSGNRYLKVSGFADRGWALWCTPAGSADLNGDGTVDLIDFGLFQEQLTGPQ
ncbi:MAG: right-handed parallel beta-helix repeat-containing protein [Planctomycetes bacterium]|nr:right-handed parallel beta-helix repeat-containing protein [Planctomycetota bacterium]